MRFRGGGRGRRANSVAVAAAILLGGLAPLVTAPLLPASASDGYASAVLADSPLAYWRLGEASGTTMVDAAGSGRDGTYSGGPAMSQPPLAAGSDHAVRFDGADDRADVAYGSWMNVDALTLESWVETSDPAWEMHVSRDNTASGLTRPFYWFANDAEHPHVQGFSVFNDGNQAFTKVYGTHAVDDGMPHHLVATYSNATHVATLYFDGVVEGTVTTGAEYLRSSTDGLQIAYNANPPSFVPRAFLDGTLDEIAYYDHTLTPSRVAAHFAAGAARVITTVAGNGSAGSTGDGGPATSAAIDCVDQLVVDGAGSTYLAAATGNRVRKVTPGGTISTVAAQLNDPEGIAVDGAGNLYVAETHGHVVRRITTGGTISMVAGTGSAGFSGDGGPATQAAFNQPTATAVDAAGNLYIADYGNNRVRKVSATGTVTTFAGTGTGGFSGDGGPATSASLFHPESIVVDRNGQVYVADTDNTRVRRIDTSGVITTIAGNGTTGFSGDGGPATSASLSGPIGIAVDRDGRMFLSDAGNQRVRMVDTDGTISTVAGTGTAGFSGDGGNAIAAKVNGPHGVAVDNRGNLLIADCGNNRIRRVNRLASRGVVGGAVSARESRSPSIANCTCQATSYPVDTASGVFWHSFDDIAIPGRGVPRALSHAYSSDRADVDGPLGFGWTHSYAMGLTDLTGSAVVHEESGSDLTFTTTDSGATYTAPPRVIASLVHNPDGSWTFTRRHRQVFTFDGTGLLVAENDLNGYTTTITRPTSSSMVVTEPSGRTLTFGLTGGRITSVTDAASPARTVTFSYDGNGNLTDVVDVGGGHWQFTYDSAHRLLTMRSPKYFGDTTTTPAPVVTNHYDAAGRVDWQSDPLGRTTTFDYTTVDGSTIVTDPAGNAERYDYVDGVLAAKTKGYGSAVAATWTYQTDPYTVAVTSVTDPNGHTTSTYVDGEGNVIAATDALGRSVTATYNSLGLPVSTTDASGVTTTMTYDGAGNLLSTSTPLVGSSPAQARVATLHYDDGSHPGDVTSVTNPLSKTSTFTYDTAGNQATATDPLGHTSRSCFDAVGRPTATISPRGVAQGVTCSTASPAAFTSYVTYNAYGAALTATDPLGHQTARTYDADGNLATTTDADSNTTTFTHDPAGELTRTHRADGTDLTADYWPDGRLHHQVDGATNATTYGYDAQGRLASTADPLGRTTSFGYDAGGNRVTKQDPGGNCAAVPKTGCTTLGYDAADQLTSITYSDGVTPNVTAIGYDLNGRRTSMTEGTGGTGNSSWAWDSLGRLTSSVDGAGKTVGYGYDLAGHLTSISYPGGAGTVSRAYDDAGRLASVTDWLTHTTTLGYDADSDLTSEALANGTTAVSTVDAAGRLMAVSHAPTATPNSPFASFSYGRDNAGQVTSVTSTGVPADNHTYTYDPLNQLAADNGAAFSYDTADNLTKQASSGGTQAFDVANELTSAVPSPISLRGTASGGDGGTTSSVTVTLPAGTAAGDQILVAATLPQSKSATTPTGYTLVGTYTSGTATTSAKVAVFRRTAAAGDSAVTVAFGQKYAKTVVVAAYANVDPATPLDVTPSSGLAAPGTSVTAPSLTPTVAGDRLVMIAGANNLGAAGTWTAGAGMVSQVQKQGGTSVSSMIADQALPSAAATGTRTAASNVSGQLVGVLVLLRPASVAYAYDSRGNRTTVTPAGGAPVSLGYDQANRLTSYGTTATYRYDGTGLRTSKTVAAVTTAFTWDQASGLPLLLADGTNFYLYDDNGQPIEHLAATGGAATYYHHDQLGSTRVLTNQSGSVVATFTYDAYGKRTATTGTATTPLGHAGQYTDTETGYTYLRARYYDPATAQFLTRDPMVAATRSAYGYVNSDPLNGTDPFGLFRIPGTSICVDIADPNCDSIKEQHQEGAQQVANFAGGVLNTLSFGNERRIDSALGQEGNVDQCSGYYTAGEYAGYAVDAIDVAAAGKDLFSKGGLRIAGSRMARSHIDEDVHAINILGREFLSPHVQFDTWRAGVKGSRTGFRIPLPKRFF